ncbi:MAG: methylmalonyl-CoA mutase family protein, partial [Chloroflexota bacterium]
YFIEASTDRIEAEVWAYLDRIEDLGGALEGIEHGFQQREIQESAYRLQRQLETKDRIVVGVNQFTTEGETPPELLRLDPEVGRKRVAQLVALRARRDNAAVEASLTKIRAAARGDENMMPLLLEAAEAYATVGEICGVLREEWGEYREILTI